MLATAMALSDRGDGGADVAAWRQIVDIVAQAGSALDTGARGAALDKLTVLRSAIPASERRLSAASLAGRAHDPDVVALFAADAPAVAAPLLAMARLDGDAWAGLIPAMPPASRNILRNRRDLPLEAIAILARYAPIDLALAGSSPEAVAVAPGITQIRDLVDRIAAYRERKPQFAPIPLPAEPVVAANFVFETSMDGIIDWVEGCPREAIVGLSIAELAAAGGAGVDGQAAGAWRRRAPFRDARLSVSGFSAAGGDWLITAAPLFNPRDGRFCGYRGDARRAGPGERVEPVPAEPIAPDSLRQLVHELRTPLNAIQGFATMIDEQLLGPAASRYRERARAIAHDAARLAIMVDDLDTAVRIDGGGLLRDPMEIADIAPIVSRVGAVHRSALGARGIELVVPGAAAPVEVATAASTAERMIARLIAATGGVATPGETLEVGIDRRARGWSVSVTRPIAVATQDEATLLDPGYGPDGEWPDAPLLGLGFTLRLIERLATRAGGGFRIAGDRFELLFGDAASLVVPSDAMVGPAGLEPAT